MDGIQSTPVCLDELVRGFSGAPNPSPFSNAAEMKTKLDYLDQIDSVPGWFHPEDRKVFVGLNQIQRECSVSGNVLEIGAYKGKSAILLGYELKAGERMVICDLFGMPPETVEERQGKRTTLWGSRSTGV